MENKALIESIMKIIKAKQLIAKTQAENRVEPVQLPKEPKEQGSNKDKFCRHKAV